MRRLILLRHAKSDWPSGVADPDRPLNARGRKAAPRMGAYLAAEGLRPDHVMVSPARRTQQTWEGLRGALPDLAAETVPSLYEASAKRILDVIRSAPGSAKTLLVIGHNPSLEDAAIQLAGTGPEGALSAMRQKFPTAALAVIDLDIVDWSCVEVEGGRLERFVTPKGLVQADA